MNNPKKHIRKRGAKVDKTQSARYRKRQSTTKSKFINDEQSFKKFQSRKKKYTVEQFVQKNEYGDLELYEDVEAFFEYPGNNVIHVIVNGGSWEYDSFKATKKKYGFLTSKETLCESNDLETVERKLFKEFLKEQ